MGGLIHNISDTFSRKFPKQIPANTLVETLVALTILSIVSGFAIMIFLAVSSPGSSMASMLSAQQKTAEMMDSLEISSNIRNAYAEIQVTNLWYFLETEEYETNVWQVSITVRDNDHRIIYTRKRLFYEPDETR